MRKNLIERENWYKQNEKDEDEEEENSNKSRKTYNEEAFAMPRRLRAGKKITKSETEKSVVFVPHTVGSKLARELRNKEEKLKDLTGEKIKIVEKSGIKIEDMIAGKDPWRGGDCKRSNCFLCNTKNITEKDMKKDCTKRNILYEIRCLSCEDREKTRILESEIEDENEKHEKIKNIKIPTYIGESKRSAYE